MIAPDPNLAAPLMLTADEFAATLRISRAHFWRLESEGKLPAPVRLGRAVRWDRRVVEAWLDAGAPPRQQWEQIALRGAKCR